MLDPHRCFRGCVNCVYIYIHIYAYSIRTYENIRIYIHLSDTYKGSPKIKRLNP